MTKKQIIIDGVDVSGCEHLYKEIDCLAHIDFSECCEGYNPSYGYCPNTDCYYKQLKHKEQECEELKAEIKHYKQIAQYHGNLSVKYTNKSAKYKQTLTEIKEIAEEQIPYLNIDKAKTMIEIEYDYAGKIYNLEQRMYKILQKISEVENAR